MTIVNGYATLDELQAWNEATKAKSTLILERAIEAASRAIDNWCERAFYQQTGNRVFDACLDDHHSSAAQVVELGGWNDLAAIVSLKTDDNADGTFETTWSAADYQLLPLNNTAAAEQRPYEKVRSLGARSFPLPATTSRVGLVQINGTWGWSAIPNAVNQACLILASRIFYRKETPHGVAGWGAFGEFRVGRTDPDVVALLAQYRYAGGVGIA